MIILLPVSNFLLTGHPYYYIGKSRSRSRRIRSIRFTWMRRLSSLSSGHMLAASHSASEQLGWVSIKMTSQPAATAALDKAGTNWGLPPAGSPDEIPYTRIEWVGSITTG